MTDIRYKRQTAILRYQQLERTNGRGRLKCVCKMREMTYGKDAEVSVMKSALSTEQSEERNRRRDQDCRADSELKHRSEILSTRARETKGIGSVPQSTTNLNRRHFDS